MFDKRNDGVTSRNVCTNTPTCVSKGNLLRTKLGEVGGKVRRVLVIYGENDDSLTNFRTKGCFRRGRVKFMTMKDRDALQARDV